MQLQEHEDFNVFILYMLFTKLFFYRVLDFLPKKIGHYYIIST